MTSGSTSMHPDKLKWSAVAAVNNDGVLNSCLLASPEISAAAEIILQRGFRSAAAAYNQALDKSASDIVVFVHQDVFLPAGWIAQFEKVIATLTARDRNWAVAGVWGIPKSGPAAGYLYCGATGRVLGAPFESPVEVSSVDEVLFIVRKSSGVRFDENLAGFHMYGTDICLSARSRGLKSYAISAFCVHNTNGYNLLPWDFWKAYFFMRKKWKRELPVATSCTTITRGCWPMIHWNADRMANLLLRRHNPGRRVDDPKPLYERLLQSRQVVWGADPTCS